jgi:hypothetical protein
MTCEGAVEGREMDNTLEMSSSDAIGAIRRDGVVEGVDIKETLSFGELHDPCRMYSDVDLPISIRGCHVQKMDTFGVTFLAPIEIVKSTVECMDFFSCFFLGGLKISQCRFHEPARILWGGHNKGTVVLIENTVFEEFVDFRDCWFMGPVRLHNVQFKKGSNLLGLKGSPVAVTFDVPAELEFVEGDIEMDGPCS